MGNKKLTPKDIKKIKKEKTNKVKNLKIINK